jgi:hypothetical protein
MLVDVDMRVTDHFGPPVRREWARVWRAWAACDLCPLWTSVRLRLASLLRCRRHRDCCEVIPQARLLTVVFLLGNSRGGGISPQTQLSPQQLGSKPWKGGASCKNLQHADDARPRDDTSDYTGSVRGAPPPVPPTAHHSRILRRRLS